MEKKKKKYKRDLAELIDCKGPVYEECPPCPNYAECQKDLLDWWTKIPNIIFDKYLAELSPAQWKVFTFLLRHRGFKKDRQLGYNNAFCTQKEISEKCGLNIITVTRALKSLEEEKFITSSLQGKIYKDDKGEKKVRRTGTRYYFPWMNNFQKQGKHKAENSS